MHLTPPGIGAFFACLQLLFFTHLAAAQLFDRPPGSDTDLASDVASVDTAWDGYYAPYEGITYTPPHEDSANDDDASLDLTRRDAKEFYLRVMPLGASIVQGFRSTDGNGFRKWIRQQLRYQGWKVNMVGSKQDGNMADRDNEGHPGWITNEIKGAFDAAKGSQPNLVLLNAGTNDCVQELDTYNMKSRYKSLVDDIFDSISGVTVIVSTLVQSRDHRECSTRVSQDIRDLVNEYKKDTSKRIELADIEKAMDSGEFLSDDGIHPTDAGYKLFAAVWWAAIDTVEDKIQPPNYVASIDDSKTSGARTCQKVAGNARGPVQSQRGDSGHDDGKYIHDRIEHGPLLSARIEKAKDPSQITDGIPDRMFFANIVAANPNFQPSEALDDWIRVFHAIDGKNTYYYRQNMGGGVFGSSTTFSVDMNCDSGPRYYFADFNGDGLADFYCLQHGSAVSVSINQGTNPPTFKSLGQVVPTHAGFSDINVRIADIDGDGRADYCLVESSGNVICSRNAGQGTNYFWQGFQTERGLREMIFNRKGTSDIGGVQLGDLNGDFRADYFFVGNNGNVETWTNQRGWGKGIAPDWTSSGITHPGQGESNVRRNIKWGRIFGSGKLDYIYLKEEEDWYDVRVWENKGSGATRRRADGNYYCDMRGTGRDDYVWIWSDGHAAEINANIQDPPYWAHDVQITLNVPGSRVGIHLADWNGDGRCDVLVQDKATGAVTPWINNWDEGKKTLTFTKTAATRNTCLDGWGVSIFDRNMIVADIDGDKRADVICLAKTGRITAFLNKPGKLDDIGQIKKTEGWDRANIKFADVESSGRADLIWVNKYTGAGSVFKNNGPVGNRNDNSDSWLGWTTRGVLYSPIGRGETMRFSNQGGLGRADLIEVLPVSNKAYTYFNECGGGSGGDDDSVADPGLPAYAQPETVEPEKYGDPTKCTDTIYTISSIPDDASLICKILYTLRIWERVLNEKIEQYKNLLEDDYDRKFKVYAGYVIEQAPDNIKKRVEEQGSDYFDCDVYEKITCCTACEAAQCTYCVEQTSNTVEELCIPDGSHLNEREYRWEPRHQPCPPDYSGRGIGGNGKQSVIWFLRTQDADRFYNDIGIDSSFIYMAEKTRFPEYYSSSLSQSCTKDPDWKDCIGQYWNYQYPATKDDYTVENFEDPKDTLTEVLDGIGNTQKQLHDAISAYEKSDKYGDGVDPLNLVWALTPTVAIVNASVNSMQTILEKGEKVESQERIAGIIAFLDTLFLVIPFAGFPLGASASAALRGLGRIATGLGDAYAVGKGIYDSVENSPAAGLLSIAGFAVGKAVWSSAESKAVSSAAKALDAGGFGLAAAPLTDLSKILNDKLKPDDEI